MLRTLLFALFLAAAVAQKDEQITTLPPKDDSGSGESPPKKADYGSGSNCVLQGSNTAIIVLALGNRDISTVDASKYESAQQIISSQLAGPTDCVLTIGAGNDKSGDAFVAFQFDGLSPTSASIANAYSGPNSDLTALFGYSINVIVARVTDNNPVGGGNGDGKGDDKATKAPPAQTEYVPHINACTSTAEGSITFTLMLPGYSLPDFSTLRQTNLRNYFGNILQMENGCVAVTNIGYDTNNNALIDVLVSHVADPNNAVGLVTANDKTNLVLTAFPDSTLTIVNLVAVSPTGVDKEDPTTTSTTTTTTTTKFDYYLLLPQLIANIDTTTGTFNAAFQQRVADGCQADRIFCVMAMNLLTNYIATLAQWNTGGEVVDKEGTQYSTNSGSGSSALSLATVLAITGGALAFVVVAAMVVAKMKTGRFVPLRPSSRVSMTSETRMLTGHTSRISVRAWPQAMEV